MRQTHLVTSSLSTLPVERLLEAVQFRPAPRLRHVVVRAAHDIARDTWAGWRAPLTLTPAWIAVSIVLYIFWQVLLSLR